MTIFPNKDLIGCLFFIVGQKRPDILYAVNFLSQFQSNPVFKHWKFLLKFLGYLKCTKNLKLSLSKVKHINLECFSDSNFSANKDGRVY